jgi:hypothetical protein
MKSAKLVQPFPQLLDGSFAPITFGCGFLECPFDPVADAYKKWMGRVASYFSFKLIDGPLSTLLSALEPLTAPPTRRLLVETTSNWTAFFDNCTCRTDAESFSAYLCGVLNCRGLMIVCSPEIKGTDGRQLNYGNVRFTLHAASGPSKWDTIRSISATHAEEWHFGLYGETLPFEEFETYQARRVRDRFTIPMLERYCKALGIRPFDEDFFATRGLLATTEFNGPRTTLSIKERQQQLGL